MPSPMHSIGSRSTRRATRAEAPQTPAAAPQPEVRRAIPVEPQATRAAAAPEVQEGARRRGLLGNLFKPRAQEPESARTSRTQRDGPTKAIGDYKVFDQGAYQERLGNGTKTIASHGCFLTSMTMASTGLTGNKDLDPSKANAVVKRAGGFAGGALEAPQAARALGMELVDRRAMTNGNAAAMRQKLDGWLAAGKPVVAGVDFKEGDTTGTPGADTDHFITILGKNANGTYTAADPAGGRRITLHVNDAGRLVTDRPQFAGTRPYRVDELAFLDRG